MTPDPKIEEEEIGEFLSENMPNLKELAPDEYDEMMGAYEKIKERYTARALKLLEERKLPDADATVKLIPPSPYAAAAIAAGVLAAKVYDKYTGGEQSKRG